MRRSQTTFLNWLSRRPWSTLTRGLGQLLGGPPPERQHKPWTMSKAREKARRVRQMERKRWRDSLPRVNKLLEEYGERKAAKRKEGDVWW